MAGNAEPPFSRVQRIMLLSPDAAFCDEVRALWGEDQVDLAWFSGGGGAVERLFTEPPDLLIVDNNLEDMPGLSVVAAVKSENVYRQLPIMLVVDREELDDGVDWRDVEIDELLVRPLTPGIIKARIRLTLARASRSFDSNPLSKLPGNTSIINRIQDLIDQGEDFALAYCDLDHFKSFNDKYGFSRGDEVLMMSARIIVNTVRDTAGADAFVGHVGGDDFVFITPPQPVEEACKRIVANFDSLVPNFYDQKDRANGCIRSTDREGNIRTFPLMAVSIAVVFNVGGRLKHYGEASQIAMALKKKAKENPKSNYVLDRRQAPATSGG